MHMSFAVYRILTKLTMPAAVAAQSVVSSYSSDPWDHNLANPRQWSTPKKWKAMGIVCNFMLFLLDIQ
jgi:hypothetical protein